MKVPLDARLRSPRAPRNEDGMAVIVVIALFAIMLLFLGGTAHSLNQLRQDMRVIERQQLRRLQQPYVLTNAIATTNTPSVTNLFSPSP